MAKYPENKLRPVALVTGGASYLGRAICLKLAWEGFDLAIHYQRSEAGTLKLSRELNGIGSSVLTLKTDLRNVGQAHLLVSKTAQRFRRLDLLVNNASLFYPTPFSSGRTESWEEIFRVNLFSPYFLSRAAFPWLKKSMGSIVNMTDIYGETPVLVDYSAYCASKSSLMAMTRFCAREMGPRVRVNAVSPGAIFIPKKYGRKKRIELLNRSALKRQGKPENIAEAVYFLATQPFITGQILKVDGGRFI